MATLGRVDWFNNRRLLGPIGNIPPAEAEQNFYAQRDVLDMVARNEDIGLRYPRGDSILYNNIRVVIRQRGNMRKAARGDNKAGCEEYREERYAAEAREFGWALLGPVPNKPGYRRYKHTCGTRRFCRQYAVGRCRLP